ncbi:helix-turn-helix transcriptional regulator [Alkalihalophilus marmarensis]|uniref:helix-turn-helix domain-containing protein n=1 Tax=Alkalihalophilus marmarensis TaxID=521377 RepID=UPI00203B9359|nr:helix-turn-helix transcriptional regulator [Alkalihalophilus marmarensis]MCM3488817.1 helix-turn-helix transcriptional regulator [Alkalihalophilus marmarensis]
MDYVEFRLLEQMAKNNIRQIKELHEKTGISRTTISALLNGEKVAIRLDTLAKLCIALNCNIGDLVVLSDQVESA